MSCGFLAFVEGSHVFSGKRKTSDVVVPRDRNHGPYNPIPTRMAQRLQDCDRGQADNGMQDGLRIGGLPEALSNRSASGSPGFGPLKGKATGVAEQTQHNQEVLQGLSGIQDDVYLQPSWRR